MSASPGAVALTAFQGNPPGSDSRPSARPDGERDDARGSLSERVELGPLQPASQSTVKFTLDVEGDEIVALAAEIGYLHRGFEKECESGTWTQAIPYTDRLNYASSVLGNTAYCLAVEKLLALETPERCGWLRVLVGELARTGDHLLRCGTTCLELGAMPPYRSAVEARERVLELQESICGARVTANYLRIGGVRHDLPAGFAATARGLLARVRARVDDLERGVARDRGAVDRLTGTGVISRQDCLRYAVTGPILRSTGEPLDLRKQQPYLVYEQLDFDVPVGSSGDNYDRFLVCVEEMRQSLRIIAQCIEELTNLPRGPEGVVDRAFDRPLDATARDRAFAFSAPRVPAGEAYGAIESANGELGFYLVSDGGERPVKVRCRAPSFFNLAPLSRMLEGGRMRDLAPTLALQNIVGGECDR